MTNLGQEILHGPPFMTNERTRLLNSTPIMHTSRMWISIRLQGTRMSRKPVRMISFTLREAEKLLHLQMIVINDCHQVVGSWLLPWRRILEDCGSIRFLIDSMHEIRILDSRRQLFVVCLPTNVLKLAVSLQVTGESEIFKQATARKLDRKVHGLSYRSGTLMSREMHACHNIY